MFQMERLQFSEWLFAVTYDRPPRNSVEKCKLSMSCAIWNGRIQLCRLSLGCAHYCWQLSCDSPVRVFQTAWESVSVCERMNTSKHCNTMWWMLCLLNPRLLTFCKASKCEQTFLSLWRRCWFHPNISRHCRTQYPVERFIQSLTALCSNWCPGFFNYSQTVKLS